MARRKTIDPANGSPNDSSRQFSPGVMGVLWLLVILAATAVFALLDVVLFPLSTLPGMSWRYFLLPPVILAFLLLVGARFTQISYSLADLQSGWHYLLATLFSSNYPILVIADGKPQLDNLGEPNLIQSIGGPGYLHIHPGNVVLVEGLDGQLRVLGSGRHFITSMQRVKEVFSLEERYAQVEKIAATSRMVSRSSLATFVIATGSIAAVQAIAGWAARLKTRTHIRNRQ